MRYFLTVYLNGKKQNTVLLNTLPSFAAGSLSMGRADTNDIILPYPSVSRKHAMLEFRGQNVEIVDMGSLNKLRVNGKAYERIRLNDGMNVTIGTTGNIITLLFNAMPEQGEQAQRQPLPRQSRESAGEKSKSFMGARVFAAMMDFTICMFMGIGAAILMLLLLNHLNLGIKIIIFLTFLITLFVVWIYFALGESGESKGTMGKVAMGLCVEDLKTNERISFQKATKRFFAKVLSTLILFLGYIPMFGKKQTLHDYLAGTKVVKNPRMKE